MAVETRAILQKMQRELTNAQQTADDEAAMKKHIGGIKLLSELLLDKAPESPPSASLSSPESSSRDVTAREARAMMGKQSSESMSQHTKSLDDHDGANGESLFDF